MHALVSKVQSIAEPIVRPLEQFGIPLADLLARVWIGLVFFRSGLQKINDWENTLILFEYEYMVPILPPEIAAYLGTANELVLPILLFVGFLARLAAVPLLGMAMVIQFVLGANSPAYNSFEHYAWMVFLLLIITRGAGKFSLDHLLVSKFGKQGA